MIGIDLRPKGLLYEMANYYTKWPNSLVHIYSQYICIVT